MGDMVGSNTGWLVDISNPIDNMQYSRSRKYLGHLSLTMLHLFNVHAMSISQFLGIWSNGWSAMGDMVGSNTGWLVDISNIS
jgi:hypothetical protein